jgi:hypothetical protein
MARGADSRSGRLQTCGRARCPVGGLREQMANIVLDNILALLAGRRPANCVDLEVYGAEDDDRQVAENQCSVCRLSCPSGWRCCRQAWARPAAGRAQAATRARPCARLQMSTQYTTPKDTARKAPAQTALWADTAPMTGILQPTDGGMAWLRRVAGSMTRIINFPLG